MKKTHFRNCLLTVILLSSSFLISLLLQYEFQVQEHITTIFIFAVFLISLFTEGYIYGIVGAIIATIAVNYAFTFPFFTINFDMPVNIISTFIMIVIAILTGTLTTKIKLNEALKAEGEKERTRANLLRAVSHDLRTPLTTIYGFSSTIIENKESLSEEQKNNMIMGIKEDAEWLIRMVENLLSITGINSGKVKLNKFPIVLDELMDSVIIKFQKRYPKEEVIINIPNEMIIIPMDAILIEQVIVNILENAVKHAIGMTKLTLKVFTIKNQVIFEIEDNGCGIDNEFLGNIFNGGGSMKKETADGNKRNAGIGLSVCSTIIKAHGGYIEAKNLKKGGAIFRFALNMEDVDEK